MKLDGISFQDLAPEYLIDLNPKWKAFLRVIKNISGGGLNTKEAFGH